MKNVGRISNPYVRIETLCQLYRTMPERVPSSKLDQEIRSARQSPDATFRTFALRDLANCAAGAKRQRLLTDGLEAARLISDPGFRAEQLSTFVGELQGTDQSGLVSEILSLLEIPE